MEINLKPIGIVHSPYKEPKGVPCQAYRSQEQARVEVFEEFIQGLDDIDGFSHIILVYYFHKAEGYKLKSKPFLDNVPRGIFAIRGPHRPNHIGISTVELLKRNGRELIVRGVDIIDGTPLLDIKPYVPAFGERYSNVKIGWLEGKLEKQYK